jgi:hypothetical protein
MRRTALALSGVAMAAIAFAQDGRDGIDYATYSASRLRCVIGNNAALGTHRAGYNGLFSLSAPDQSESVYVPLYAGVNLEHYFDARPRDPDAKVFFEPRNTPMEFRSIGDRTAELHQPPTPVFKVESWTTFELRDPYYVHVTFRCVPREAVFQGGYMGVFWASYINAPLDKSMYFLREGSGLDAPVWAQLCTQVHGRDSTVRHEKDERDLPMPPASDTLYNSMSPLRFSQPFFYGRFRDMVLIYIFEPNPYLRFAHSPSGGGKTPAGDDTCPAWDFQLVVPDYQVGEQYGLRLCVVYKPWSGRADVLDEVRLYYTELGR